MALAVPSLDGYPYGLTLTLGLDDLLLQAVNPDAAIDDLPHEFVLAYEDAPLGVLGAVARMDADALEFGHTEQDGQPLLQLRAP